MNHNNLRFAESPRISAIASSSIGSFGSGRRLLVSAAALIYAALRPNTWEAVQTLIIRNEAANNDRGPGKFGQVEEMKTVQETILELARSRSVLETAMKQVGPPADCKNPESWPSDRDVDDFRAEVKLVPPKGAEFGKTEVFYLAVRDHDRNRALALEQSDLRTIANPLPTTPRRQGPKHGRRVDQDRIAGESRSCGIDRPAHGDRKADRRRSGRTAGDAGSRIGRQLAPPQRGGNPLATSRDEIATAIARGIAGRASFGPGRSGPACWPRPIGCWNRNRPSSNSRKDWSPRSFAPPNCKACGRKSIRW